MRENRLGEADRCPLHRETSFGRKYHPFAFAAAVPITMTTPCSVFSKVVVSNLSIS